jgi:monothiol glutaredoxin
MWLLLQGWLLRHVLALLGWLAAAAAAAAVVQALTDMGVKFKGIDVLTDPGLREGIKQFTNWPTIPQLYVGGEFVGGCDIVREMHENGELQQLLERKGVAYSS